MRKDSPVKSYFTDPRNIGVEKEADQSSQRIVRPASKKFGLGMLGG